MTESAEISIVRTFDAPRELVFRNLTRPAHVAAWFAPAGYTVTSCTFDARPGGRWRVQFQSPAGQVHVEHGEVLEVERPSHLVFTLVQEDDRGNVGERTTVSMALSESAAKTTLTFRQTGFSAPKVRDGNAEGWEECFRKLEANAGAEREIRALFEKWTRDSHDLEASMAPIADDIHSYEHVPPMELHGLTAVREVCKRGLDVVPADFRWDVPDLHVVVRGDLAITWGLNRMHMNGTDTWSRGTRLFQKRDGAWKLIHQHLSFPTA
jgi:uncharacterized protein YndB with AHSA1/START domain/ketosteroid isomerase-like protein